MATLSGILINKTTGNGIANLALELWDAEGILNEPVAKFTSLVGCILCTTNDNGNGNQT